MEDHGNRIVQIEHKTTSNPYNAKYYTGILSIILEFCYRFLESMRNLKDFAVKIYNQW